MGEFSVERLATDLSIEKYLAPPPRQGVVGTLYVLVLVAGVVLAVALTVLFVQVALLQESSSTAGSRPHASTQAASGTATDGEGGTNVGGDSGSQDESGTGGYRLKDFYLECALATNRQRTGPGDLVACGQPADVMLASAFKGV
jgi:hypothetical protein